MWKFNILMQCRRLPKKPLCFCNPEQFLKSSSGTCFFSNVSDQTNTAPIIRRTRKSYQEGEYTPYRLLLLLVPVGCFALGCWQVQRKKWKEGLLAELDYKTTLVPTSLPENFDDLREMEYRPVRVKGTFDHSHEVYLGPRTLILSGESVSSNVSILSQQDANKTGFHVITPFKLSDRDETILVNRGWVPSKMRDPRTRFAGQIEGEVELEGVVRLSENRAPFMPENKNPHQWSYRDVEKMARFLNTSPVFLDAKVESSVPGGPVGGQTRVTLRNEHLNYIITWYSLSAATGYMWYKNILRKRI